MFFKSKLRLMQGRPVCLPCIQNKRGRTHGCAPTLIYFVAIKIGEKRKIKHCQYPLSSFTASGKTFSTFSISAFVLSLLVLMPMNFFQILLALIADTLKLRERVLYLSYFVFFGSVFIQVSVDAAQCLCHLPATISP